MSESRPAPDSKKRGHSSSVLRGTLTLSIGTALVRAGSALTQLLLAIWLLPAEFGTWAAAIASLTFFTSIVNFGEVNGYLSGRAPSFHRLQRTTRRMNAVLTGVALIAIVPIWLISGPDTAALALIVAIGIPIQGEADTLYALGVKQRAYGRLVLVQSWSSGVKLALSIAIAIPTGTALAIAIPALVYNVCVVIALRGLSRNLSHETTRGEIEPVSTRASLRVRVCTSQASSPPTAGRRSRRSARPSSRSRPGCPRTTPTGWPPPRGAPRSRRSSCPARTSGSTTHPRWTACLG